MSEPTQVLGPRPTVVLIVAVDSYDDVHLPDLPGARASAQRFAAALAEEPSLQGPLDMRQQPNPTRAELVEAIAQACDDAKDRLIFYFSGHGVTSRDGELVLAPRDCDPQHPELTGLPWESLTRELAHTVAPSLLAVIDTCRTGRGLDVGMETDGVTVWQTKSHVAPPVPQSRRRSVPFGTATIAATTSWPYQPGAVSSAFNDALTSGRGRLTIDKPGELADRVRAELANQPPSVTISPTPGVAGQPQIFISYRFGDVTGASAAARLGQVVLSRFGPQAMFHEQNFVPVGTSLTEDRLNAIRHSQVVFAVMGEDWETAIDPEGRQPSEGPADSVAAELELAEEAGISIVPVLVGDRDPLRPENLPPSLRRLASSRYVHLPRDANRDQIAALIDQFTSHESSTLSPTDPPEGLLDGEQQDPRTVETTVETSGQNTHGRNILGRDGRDMSPLEVSIATHRRTELPSLYDWLSSDTDLARRSRITIQRDSSQVGATATEAVSITLSDASELASSASAFLSWLRSRPQAGPVTITRPDGVTIVVRDTSELVSYSDVEALFRSGSGD